MKALTKYAALALVAGLWSCTSTRTAQQQGEYDDLYFSSKDREQELVASTSASALKYDQMNKENDTYSQQNANPDYVESSSNGRRDQNRNGDAYNAGDTYYDDDYITDRRKFGSIRPSVTTGFGGGYAYTSPAYYDPFFSPYGYDPFYAQNAYSSFYYDPFFSNRPYWGFRPGVSINLSFNSWGRPWGWHDPFWGARPWGGYNAWNSWGGWGGYGYDPFWGGGNMFYSPVYNNYYGYGGGWNRPWYGGNTVIVGNGGRDNTVNRNYGPRGSRGSERVNDRLDNSPRDRNNGGGRLSQENNTGDGQMTRPTRARTPRSGESDPYGTTRPSSPREGYSSGRTGANANPDVITTRPAPSSDSPSRGREVYSSPRPTRPQGDGGSNQRSTDYYNNSRSTSQPSYSAPRNDSYSAPSPSRSNSGGYEYSRPSRSGSDYNSGGGSYNSGRSSGGSSPSPSNSGGSSGGSRARGRN